MLLYLLPLSPLLPLLSYALAAPNDPNLNPVPPIHHHISNITSSTISNSSLADTPAILTITCARPGTPSLYTLYAHKDLTKRDITASELCTLNSLASLLQTHGTLTSLRTFATNTILAAIEPEFPSPALPSPPQMPKIWAAKCLFRAVGYLLPGVHGRKPFRFTIAESRGGLPAAKGFLMLRHVEGEMSAGVDVS